jgi:CheY-like chemotaxis protein
VPEKSPLYLFENTVRVLIVDDEPLIRSYFSEMISEYPLMSVQTAESSKEAENIISKRQPHICILDLGLNDVECDEFFLLKKYARDFPVIVVSAATDIERAFAATNCGAAGMFAKPLDFYSIELWQFFRDIFLGRCLLPVTEKSAHTVFHNCCEVLINRLPENVAQWANLVGVTDAYLRKMWSEYYMVSPKHILFMFKLYRDVFDYYSKSYLAKINGGEQDEIVFKEAEWRPRICYYLVNKNTFTAIVNNKSRQKGIALDCPNIG